MTKNELEMLLDEQGQSLSAFCYTIGRSRDAAEEIFQEVCLRLLRKKTAVRIEKNAASYLYRTALNVYRDMCRKAARRPEISIEDADAVEYVSAVAKSEDEYAEYEALYRAIGRLPLRYREVIHLVYFRSISVSGAASVLGVPEGTVKSRLHKARQLLKKELENEDQ